MKPSEKARAGICALFVLGALTACKEQTIPEPKMPPVFVDDDVNNATTDPVGPVDPTPEDTGTIGSDLSPGYMAESILGETLPVFASGNEPFWTAEIGNGWIVFERPGLPLVEVPVPEFEESGDQVNLKADGLHLQLSKSGCRDEPGSLGIVIKFEAVEFEGESEDISYVGCAGSASGLKQDGTQALAWKDLITPSIMAIDACLDQHSDHQLIVALYPREPGTVGMILSDERGSYFECGADTETGEIYFLDPMTAAQAADWMTGAAFVRSGQAISCQSDGDALESDAGLYFPQGC